MNRRWWITLAVVSIGACLAFAFMKESELPTEGNNDERQPAEIVFSVGTDSEPDVRRLIEEKLQEIKTNKTDPRTYAELAMAYEANSHWEDARKAYQRAIELSTDASQVNPNWLIHQAIVTQQAGFFTESLQLLKQLATRFPTHAAVQQRAGQALLDSNELAEAETVFQRVIQHASNAAEGYTGLADVRLRQGDVKSAIQLLKKAIDLDKTYRVAHFLLGTAFQREQRMDLAARELRLGQHGKVRFLPDELTPQIESYAMTIRARHQRAIRQMNSRQFKQAASTLEGALKAEPNHVAMLNLLAGVYMHLDRSDDAHQLLLRAKQLDSENSTTYVNFASWHLHKGQLKDALQNIEQALAISNWLSSAHFVKIETLIRMKQFNEARRAVNEAAQHIPVDQRLLRYAKQLKMQNNRQAKALSQ